MGDRGRAISMEQRQRIVILHEQGVRDPEIAERLGISGHTVKRWIKRYQEQGRAGLVTRSKPMPKRPPRQTPQATEDRVCALWLEGHGTALIAEATGLCVETVRAILERREAWAERPPRPARRVPQATEDWVVEMLRRGWKTRCIAETAGIHPDTVRAIRKRQEVP